jgi:iron-sulfur cluster assembly protein
VETTTPVVGLTENAVTEIKRLQQVQGTEALPFRLGVKGGGCSGLSYTMNFDKDIATEDNVYEIGGVKLVVDPKSAIYLSGTTLDYKKEIAMTGFTFINPNAEKSCGCGESFAVK